MKAVRASLLIILSIIFILLPSSTRSQEQEKQPEEQPIILQNQNSKEASQGKLSEGELSESQRGQPSRQDTPRNPSAKVVVIGADGKKRELDTSGAEGVILNQTLQSIVENGEKRMRVQGKAVVIGPDGTRTEFDLAEPLEKNQGLNNLRVPEGLDRVQRLLENLPDNAGLDNLLPQHRFAMPSPWRLNHREMGKFTIGLSCSPVSAALRHHLNLNNQSGLLVDKVEEGSPAAEAGIQQYDILLYADQNDLTSIETLTDAVTKAGNEGLPLSLNLLRKGKELGVEIKPIERPSVRARADRPLGGTPWDQIAPGIIIGGETELGDFEQKIQQMKEQMQKQMEEMHEQMRLFRDPAPENGLDKSGL